MFGGAPMLQRIVFLLPSKGLCIFFLILFCLTAQIVFGQNTPKSKSRETIALELGKPDEREFAANDADRKHTYQIFLSANQYANVIVEQRGVDVTARVLTADEQLIADVDSDATVQGSERIELVAEVAGSYKIEIKPSLPKAGIGKYSIRVSELRGATIDEKSLDEARRLYYEGLRLTDAGKFDDALVSANRALEIREKISSSSRAELAASLRSLGAIYLNKNNLAQAEIFLHRAADTTAKTSGNETLDYAEALSGLAMVRFNQANYAEAEQLNERSLAVREKTAGADSVTAAKSLFNLAMIYRSQNNLPKAEQTYLKVLTIREKLLGENHFEVAQALNNLGLLYYGAGDYKNATAALERSLEIKEKALPPNHFQTGRALNNLGLVEWKKENYKKAETYYLRALNIFKIANGDESDGVASISHNLGIIYKEDGNPAEAEKYYKRALAIWEKIFGENYQGTANAASSLAILYRNSGDYERAEQFQLRAQTIYEKVLGEYNYYTMLSLGSLVKLYVSKGDAHRAVEYMKRIEAIEQKIIPLNLSIGSERQKIAYYNQLEPLDRFITLHAKIAPDNASANELAITAVLQRKGRILDALSENLSALRRRFNPQDQLLLDNLNDVTSQLSRLILSGKQKRTVEEYQNQIKTLEAEKEKLESEIGRRSANFYESSQPITLAAVRAAIPPDAALVEFAVYRPYNFKGKSEETNSGEPRYVAYVLRRDGDVQWKDLGDAKTINAAIGEWRKALRDPKQNDVSTLARAVDEKIMQPIRASLGDAKKLLVSPDGELNLIPFEALYDEKGHYLVENYSFTYLTSGRDLLRMQVARTSKSKTLLIANPQFSETSAEQMAETDKTMKTSANSSKRQSVIATRNMTDTYFAPLGGTLQEARVIQTLFPNALFLTGTQATETALKQANAPEILHIATHGFFLEDENSLSGKSAASRNAKADVETENPLLRSGLALAGANRRGAANSGGDDGILTALEASGLNLWGTKLVVLSACDTGLGEVKNGEGVYGLRRAFTLAGTETLLMSLWSVSDYATRELMTNYYKNLKRGMGRGESLRKVQLEMLKRKERTHPFYWAAFIQSGEWANLDGRR